MSSLPTVTCGRDSLVQALELASSILPARPSRPSCGLVLLDPFDKTISASIPVMGVRVALAGMLGVESWQGSTGMVLDPKSTLAMLRSSGPGTLYLTLDGGTIRFEGDGVTGHQPVELAATDFPAVPRFGEPTTHARLAWSGLRRAILRTVDCTDIDYAGKYELGGCKIDFEPGHMKMTATDGRRLAVHSQPAVVEGSGFDVLPSPALVPAKALRFLAKLPDSDDPARLTILPQDARWGLSVKVRGVEVYAPFLDGRFPRIEGIYPQNPPCTVKVRADDLLRVVEPMMGVHEPSMSGLDLTVESGRLGVGFGPRAGCRYEYSRYTVDVPAEVPDLDGWAYDVTLNPAYMLDFLASASDAGVVTIEIVDGKSGVRFRTEDGSDLLIMPMVVDGRDGKPRRVWVDG